MYSFPDFSFLCRMPQEWINNAGSHTDPIQLLDDAFIDDEEDSRPTIKTDKQAFLRNSTSIACSPTEKVICFSPEETDIRDEDLREIQRAVSQFSRGIKLRFDDFDIGLIKVVWNPMLVKGPELNEVQMLVRNMIASRRIPPEKASRANRLEQSALSDLVTCINI